MQSNSHSAVTTIPTIQGRRRIRGPNTKSGCVTCKRRRVKCDERKGGATGGCLRCENLGIKCDWISIITASNPQVKRTLRPKYALDFQPIFYQPSTALCQSNQELKYFQIFCTNIAPNLSGNPEGSLWNTLVLQACESNPSIRYAVIAIAALKCTTEAEHARERRTATDDAATHHQFALKVYSKAVRQMREATMAGKQDLRTTLLSCIVLTCFEAFHGDHESAVQQIGIGVKILQDHLVDDNQTHPKIPDVEYELVQAFGRLEIQSMAFIDTQSMDSHRQQKDYGQASLQVMPEKFTSLNEAEFYFGIVVQRLLHWGVSCVMPDCAGCLKMDTSLCIPDEQVPVREKHLGEMRRWHDAFVPILKEARNSTSSRMLLGASSMQLVYLTSYFSAGIIRDSSQEYTDTRKFMPFFRQIVSLSRSIVEHPEWNQGKSMFAFEMQVVAPLYNVARRCPHRALRREAISLLFAYPRREGLWDGMLAGKLAEWVVLLEEEHLDKQLEYIPEHLRCKGIDTVECNMVTRRAFVKGMLPNQNGELVEHESILTW